MPTLVVVGVAVTGGVTVGEGEVLGVSCASAWLVLG
jgi:hypothetical protein